MARLATRQAERRRPRVPAAAIARAPNYTPAAGRVFVGSVLDGEAKPSASTPTMADRLARIYGTEEDKCVWGAEGPTAPARMKGGGGREDGQMRKGAAGEGLRNMRRLGAGNQA